MAVGAVLRESWYRVTGRSELAEQLQVERVRFDRERSQAEWLQESLAELETRMYEPGWQLLTARGDQEFTREGLRQITAVARVMAIKNCMIKRALSLRHAYVWGQGVSITARDTDVGKLIKAFLGDPSNRRTFSGAAAREEHERALGTDGNVFFALFTSPLTGRVQVRVLPWDEIGDIVTNPEDASEPWFYRRDWWEERRNAVTGGPQTIRRVEFYPALGYRPSRRLARVRGATDGQWGDVVWDAPVCHVKVGALLGWKFGIGDSYAALDWANAYREFLTDWARLVKSLSRFAWKLTTRGSRQSQARNRVAQAPTTDPVTGEARRTGATALLTPEMQLEAIPKTGATIDSDSGRPLAAMVATAMDVPVTMLLGDPGTTGARATAETLDTPTERSMQARRALWTEAIHAILTYVITESVRAPNGRLQGTVVVDPWTGQDIVSLTGDGDGEGDVTVDISWPDLDDIDAAAVVEAIVKADSTTHVPPQVIVRLLLEALGVHDVDGILAGLVDDHGRWLGPDPSPGAEAMQGVLDRGMVPAPALDGPVDDESPVEGDEPDNEPSQGQRPQPRRGTRAQRRRR